MNTVARFQLDGGGEVFVEMEDDAPGVQRASRDGRGFVDAAEKLDKALETIRPTAERVLAAVRDLAPDEKEIEFGIKLNVEAGALIARTAAEAHFKVTLKWADPAAGPHPARTL